MYTFPSVEKAFSEKSATCRKVVEIIGATQYFCFFLVALLAGGRHTLRKYLYIILSFSAQNIG